MYVISSAALYLYFPFMSRSQSNIILLETWALSKIFIENFEPLNVYQAWRCILTLKAPNKNCSRRHFNFLILSFEENKA